MDTVFSCHVRHYHRVFSVFGGVSLSKFMSPFLDFTCYVRVFLQVFSVGIWPLAIAMLGCYLGCSSIYILCIWLSFPGKPGCQNGFLLLGDFFGFLAVGSPQFPC